MRDFPFDRVVVTDANLQQEELTLHEFLSLPLHRRIRFVLQRKVEFFRGALAVERSEALKSLMQHQAPSAS